jgi:hypothetical protein
MDGIHLCGEADIKGIPAAACAGANAVVADSSDSKYECQYIGCVVVGLA